MTSSSSYVRISEKDIVKMYLRANDRSNYGLVDVHRPSMRLIETWHSEDTVTLGEEISVLRRAGYETLARG